MNSNASTLARPWSIAGQSSLAQVLWIIGLAAATALAAQVYIPVQPVPFTLQTMIVLLAGASLGPRNGAMSQFLYLGVGAIGLPVFAGGAIGFARLLGPTGGYLLAFPVAAAIVGYLVQRKRSLLWTVVSMLAGLLVIFVAGTAQLALFTGDLSTAVTSGFLLFTGWDLLKLGAASMTYHEIAKRWPRVGSTN
jgi:biotin transport system substrate-specific component